MYSVGGTNIRSWEKVLQNDLNLRAQTPFSDCLEEFVNILPSVFDLMEIFTRTYKNLILQHYCTFILQNCVTMF